MRLRGKNTKALLSGITAAVVITLVGGLIFGVEATGVTSAVGLIVGSFVFACMAGAFSPFAVPGPDPVVAEFEKLFVMGTDQGGVILLERWPEGLVLWYHGSIVWRSWQKS